MNHANRYNVIKQQKVINVADLFHFIFALLLLLIFISLFSSKLE